MSIVNFWFQSHSTHSTLDFAWLYHVLSGASATADPWQSPATVGFLRAPWDAGRCLMEKTCDDNRWCQMTQCWWRSFQILLKNSRIFGMLSIWECEKSERSLSHVRFLVVNVVIGQPCHGLNFADTVTTTCCSIVPVGQVQSGEQGMPDGWHGLKSIWKS